MLKLLTHSSVLFMLFSANAYAQEPIPGDSCSGYPQGAFMTSGGPELDGRVYRLSCEGGTWTDLDESCENGPIGTRCMSDGAIYAGDVGGKRIYAAACDHGMSWDGSSCTGSQTLLAWDITNTNLKDATKSMVDGKINTDEMESLGLALRPAAEACRNAGAQWYLPARDELGLLYDNLVGQGDTTPGGPLGSTFDFNIGGSNAGGGRYWSSTEHDSDGANSQLFSTGEISSTYGNKLTQLAVRCVRKEGSLTPPQIHPQLRALLENCVNDSQCEYISFYNNVSTSGRCNNNPPSYSTWPGNPYQSWKCSGTTPEDCTFYRLGWCQNYTYY